MNRHDIPRLPGYLTIIETADALGVTRQNIHKMLNAGKPFEQVVRVGTDGNPIYLFQASEVARIRLERESRTVTPADLPASAP